MQTNVLTVLGCSSSIALLLLTGDPAQAKTETSLREYVFTAPNASETVAELSEISCECNNVSSEATFDQEGDRAVLLYGCDCAGCRFMARNSGSDLLNLSN